MTKPNTAKALDAIDKPVAGCTRCHRDTPKYRTRVAIRRAATARGTPGVRQPRPAALEESTTT